MINYQQQLGSMWNNIMGLITLGFIFVTISVLMSLGVLDYFKKKGD